MKNIDNNRPLNERNYTCFLQAMKDVAKEKGPIEINLIDTRGNTATVRFEGENNYVDKVKTRDPAMRRYLSHFPGDMERFFLETAKDLYPEGELQIRFMLAKLADKSFLYDSAITINIPNGREKEYFTIYKNKNNAAFKLNEKEITYNEAINYVKKNQGNFLVNMKGGVKTARKKAEGFLNYDYNTKSTNEINPFIKQHEDGTIVTDIDAILQKKVNVPRTNADRRIEKMVRRSLGIKTIYDKDNNIGGDKNAKRRNN